MQPGQGKLSEGPIPHLQGVIHAYKVEIQPQKVHIIQGPPPQVHALPVQSAANEVYGLPVGQKLEIGQKLSNLRQIPAERFLKVAPSLPSARQHIYSVLLEDIRRFDKSILRRPYTAQLSKSRSFQESVRRQVLAEVRRFDKRSLHHTKGVGFSRPRLRSIDLLIQEERVPRDVIPHADPTRGAGKEKGKSFHFNARPRLSDVQLPEQWKKVLEEVRQFDCRNLKHCAVPIEKIWFKIEEVQTLDFATRRKDSNRLLLITYMLSLAAIIVALVFMSTKIDLI
jgi:hypothetical protein